MNVYGTTVSSNRHLTTNKTLGSKTLTTNIIDANNKQVRYFSGIDAEIYFDMDGQSEQFIDEIVDIQFQVQQNALPLYGYNSHTFDDIAIGSRLISGQFAINFTSGGYLFDVLKTMNAISAAESGKGSMGDALFSQEHSPLWNTRGKNFDIVLGYGDYKDNGPNATMLILHDVQITGCSQQLSITGEPVLEMYSFIAKDIRTSMYLGTAVKSDTGSTASDDSLITITSAEYSEEVTKEYKKTDGMYGPLYKTIETAVGHLNFAVELADGVTVNTLWLDTNFYSSPDTESNDGLVVLPDGKDITYDLSTDQRKSIKSILDSVYAQDTKYFYVKIVADLSKDGAAQRLINLRQKVEVKNIEKDV